MVTLDIYDAVVARRSADGVLAGLQSRTSCFYARLERAEKIEFVRRARALPAVHLYIGEFNELTLDVAATTWDEVLNQLVFLLSL